MGIFRRRDEESMDPQELLARGHADMAESSAVAADQFDSATSGFRLTVADVFLIRGRGTVLTGVVEAGVVRVGSSVLIMRAGQVVAQTIVGGIEKFRDTVDEASVGENIGMLVPDMDRAAVQCGDVVVAG